MPDFISWFKRKVLCNFAHTQVDRLLCTCDLYNDLSCLNLQSEIDLSMNPELRQVVNGFEYRVKSFSGYDVNEYCFHITRHEQKRPNRRTTNFGVFTPGLDGVEYYGKIEEIYELKFRGCKPLNPVVFKCHWFDPQVMRRTPTLGLVKIRQDSFYGGKDVYIVTQQATQVYYLPYSC